MTAPAPAFNREALENILARRFFVAPSFEIYGGTAGLYDFGPPGTALLNNFIDTWRKHFVLEEDMLEVDSTILTPYEVLKTSGHVDRFCDWMVKDTVTGDIYRADHLVENVLEARLEADVRARMSALELEAKAKADKAAAAAAAAASGQAAAPAKKTKQKVEVAATKLDAKVRTAYEEILAQIDNYGGDGLARLIREHDIRTPEGNPVTAPVEFNLMFDTSVGPTGDVKAFLRPETAQGQFVNFAKLLEYNNGRMPFASASIGRSFRNEISPRNGLLRVREFLMAEIEHYVDPEDKSHPGFASHADVVLNLLPAKTQLAGSTTISHMKMGDAVKQGIIDNETLGYFLARVHLFLVKVGVNPTLLRFRQHMSNEMAHYACDCWDAELRTSYGWIECVGCADRSAYDLTRHSERTNKKLVVRQALAEPRISEKWTIVVNKKKFGPAFKRAAKDVEAALMALDELAVVAIKDALAKSGAAMVATPDGAQHKLDATLVTVERVTIKEHVREYTPNVIEPSFGVGRILSSLLEHTFYSRPEDAARGVLSLPPCMAPIKALIVPLSNNTAFSPLIHDLRQQLRRRGLATRVDDSASSIGKRYARNDELGTPFALTVDFQSVKDNTVTLRERDSTKQIREPVATIINLVDQLVNGETTWDQVIKKYKVFTEQEA
ncbi:glycine-tRNA ligase [Allomyces macrogynus ATCC 38327]|uniref:glycine--tRNA ligase n=1 Tax=Allomyces macrogynus (strain ATCC 38327) TaxID=578462 RepID=A0A0L0SID5_ALLM3|nr:glycine-tRNA ligase [Allomyces macrogynus ATCC 38327]|eukprot:KNE62281.1 glycine-tRNA ligase [Allomyces macrogynus ATCC 38327]